MKPQSFSIIPENSEISTSIHPPHKIAGNISFAHETNQQKFYTAVFLTAQN